MTVFKRNSTIEGLLSKGSRCEWWSANLVSLVSIHVITEDGEKWKARLHTLRGTVDLA
jgi:hypothetical protein